MKRKQYNRKAAGIDTGKDKLDIAIHGSPDVSQVANDGAGHRQLVQWLGERQIKRVDIEATGGYEKAVVAALRRAGFQIIVFQPKQIRCLAGFKLQRAKNDCIDAALIAMCAAFCEEVREGPDPRLQELAEPLTLIDQLTEDIARWKTRLEHVHQAEPRRWIEDEILVMVNAIVARCTPWIKTETAL